jgi:accD: acetyl-CoA carboxylase, carboxyl transferase, beta subunit
MNEKDNRTDRNKENIPAVPPGMWIKCTKCGKLIYRKELEKINLFV